MATDTQSSPVGLMDYLIQFQSVQSRDENVNIVLNNIRNALNILKTALAFSYTQSKNEELEIKRIISAERFKDMVDPSFDSISLRLETYFKLNDSVLTLKENEALQLFSCIKELITWLDACMDNLEARQVNEMESGHKEIDENKPADEFANLLPPIEEVAEEEEEVSPKHYYYECSNPECKKVMVDAEVGGCRGCGEEKINVRYL